MKTQKEMNKIGEKNMQRFYKWMAVRVKSVHLADNEKMSEAFVRVYASSQS